MKQDLKDVAYIIIFAGILCIAIKIFLQDKITKKNKSDELLLFNLFRRSFSIKYLFPMPNTDNDRRVKTANTFLQLFYLFLIVSIILGIVTADRG